MSTRLLTGTLILLLSCWSNGHAQNVFSGIPFINNYAPSEYGGGIQNWQIIQDKRGLIYVANNFGVLEFDGSSWRLHPVPKGTKIRSLSVDGDGRIYVGSQGDFGIFFTNKLGQLTYTSLVDSLPVQQQNIDEVWRVFNEDGKAYFCTFSNIYIYDGEKIDIIKSNLYLEPSFFTRSKLYVQSPGNSLMALDNNHTLQPIRGGSFFRDKLITGILPYSKEQLLITTKNSGLYTYDGVSAYAWNKNGAEWMPTSAINYSQRLQDGKIVLGTQSEGLFVLGADGNLLLHLNKSNGLASNTVLSLFQDRSGNLWAGLNNGISHVELASPFTQIGHNLGVEGTGYVGYLKNKELYLGTNIGLYKSKNTPSNDGGIMKSSYEKLSNTDGQVYNIQSIGSDLFIGHHRGAFIIQNDESKQISTTGAWTFSIYPNNNQKIILGTYSGISNLFYENNQWFDRGRMFGFYESSRVLEIDEENYLWMAHGYKGAFRLKVNYENDSIEEVKFYNSNHGFPSDILINVFKIKNELVFTAERGIYKYDKQLDRFKPHPVYSELLGPDIHISDMDEDPLGNIYIITNNKCGVLRQNAAQELILDFDTFNKVPKLLNDDLVNVNSLDLNNVLFSGKEGFIHYEPNKSSNVNQDYACLIRKVESISHGDSLLFDGNYLVNDKISSQQTSNYEIQLPYTHNDLRFTFSSPFYEGVADMRYKYRLNNFDEDWSNWNTKTEKEYTNLPEGEYEFIAVSQNVFGVNSVTASYKFNISPPWHRTYLAYTFYAFCGLFIIAIGMFFVDRKHKKDKVILQHQQKMELSNKEEQLQSVQQQKEAEITTLKNDKLNAELNHKSTELTSATMHLLTKNELINEIKNKLVNIKDQAVKTEIKNSIGKILKEIEASTGLDKDWEQLEFHFDRVHRDFNKRIKKEFPDLTPTEMKLCIYLRLNFTTKEIAQLLHISVRGVEISRYRLRKKLELKRDQNLSDFILAY